MPLAYNARDWKDNSSRLPTLETVCVANVGNHRSRLDSIPEVASVKKKIGHVSAYYDPGRIRLDGFTSSSLDPTALKEQLRRNFDISVSPAELGAIMTMFDKDRDGTVDCAEFLHEFFKIGRATRDLDMRNNIRAQVARKQRDERRVKSRQEKFSQLATLRRVKYTKPDLEAAMDKLNVIAEYWDKERQGSLEDFVYGDEMEPTVFREQLRRNFNLLLSPAELFALFDYFDIDGSGRVDGTEFLVQFFRIGRKKRSDSLERKRSYEARRAKEQEDFRRGIKEKYAKLVKARTSESFTEADARSAVAKVARVAAEYDGGSILRGGGGLAKFSDAAAMDPTTFREQLKQLFNVRLTPEELSGLIAHFDKDGDGHVDGAEFLSTFFRLAQQGKSKNLRKHQKILERIHRKNEERQRQHVERFAKKTEASISYPQLDEGHRDLDRKKLATMRAGELQKMSTISRSTKDFLRELEKGERKIMQMKIRPDEDAAALGL